ncbi:CRISPR type I-E-associated protein CasB/Cse2 [Mobiluncus mulieris]|uniref:CRISPR type I-E/ECOLI-associated protein CasB/Cse2 n=1 Tax=Mobiluncus mulieris TaxID=2052 RepID=A0A8G2HVL1_9ACTO|nr:type I-E CRISPR-associated protein Cse2/CasB [Mobiluncus mulieris]MBB5846388.1 CRISPR type I-E-associated protein CasB/Cse2 [Mobiluncus mulieris]MCV0012170.1 type I-E CRISPR-associated protein Cse2/CasB [Mobiluncus mulieris]STO17131.1 CRISPR type I-E/ECOLI-associated protein CasB/Cse2 [Mobiluncus mulieris]
MSKDEPWKTLVSEVLRRRNEKNYRSTLAALKRGRSTYTENAAYPFVLPYSEGVPEKALLRGVSLIADFPEIPQVEKGEDEEKKPVYTPLGESFALTSKSLAYTRGAKIEFDKPDAIAQRLRFLPNLGLENAALTLRSILKFVEKYNHPIDWYQLVQLLTHWGKGVSVSSQKSRNRVLHDYYVNLRPYSSDNSNETPNGEEK